MANNGFRYVPDIRTATEPWREKLGQDYESVVARLVDRDRALEDYLNGAAWTDWVPTLTNMTLGNGTVLAKYHKIGRLVTVRFTFTLGSTSAMGTAPKFTLPVTAANAQDHYAGACFMTDVSTNIYTGFAQIRDSGATAQMRVSTASGTYVGFADITATIPITWANTHWIDAAVSYEASS